MQSFPQCKTSGTANIFLYLHLTFPLLSLEHTETITFLDAGLADAYSVEEEPDWGTAAPYLRSLRESGSTSPDYREGGLALRGRRLCPAKRAVRQAVWGHSLQHPERAFPSALRPQSSVTKDGPQQTCSLAGWFSFKKRSTNTDGRCWNPPPSSSCKKCTILPWILPGQPSGSHLPLLPWRGLLPVFGICQSHVVLSSQM